jgi:hypothetical protein
VIAIVVLTAYQFVLQRGQLLEELHDEAIAHDVLLASVTKTVRDHVRSLATWAEIYLAEPDPSSRPADPGDDQTFPGGTVPGRDTLAGRPGAGAELAAAERLVPHMRIAHRAMPYLQRSYYLSGEEDFLRVFPRRDGADAGGAASDQLLDLLREQDLLQGGLRAGNGAGRESWTRAWRDPEGTGWVVAHAAPIGAGDDVVGVVGSTVSLDFLSGFLRAFDYPSGHLWLVNQHGQMLASSDGPILAGLQLKTLGEVLPAALREVAPATLLRASAEFRATATSTCWRSGWPRPRGRSCSWCRRRS